MSSTGPSASAAAASVLALSDLASWASTSPPLDTLAVRRDGPGPGPPHRSGPRGKGNASNPFSCLKAGVGAEGKGTWSEARVGGCSLMARLGPSGVGLLALAAEGPGEKLSGEFGASSENGGESGGADMDIEHDDSLWLRRWFLTLAGLSWSGWCLVVL